VKIVLLERQAFPIKICGSKIIHIGYVFIRDAILFIIDAMQLNLKDAVLFINKNST